MAQAPMPALPAPLTAAVAALARLPEVGAVLLAGSHGAGTADAASDFDVYVYGDAPIDASARRAVLAPHCGEMEWDNRFWEAEDDGVLADGTPVEFIYRSFDAFESMLAGVVERCEASVGYTTCFWANLRDSQVLFDRSGRAAALQARFDQPYPPALQRAIVAKNLPLLADSCASYLHQIEKAAARDDRVSLNHRIAAWLASYFDILFAANARLHPGEKRLLAQLAALPEQPPHALADVNALLSTNQDEAAAVIRRLVAALKTWLLARGLP